MGLTAQHGYLSSVSGDPQGVAWFRQDLAAVNAVLRANGLPEHDEPAELPPHDYRCATGSIAWSWLHCLRRLHALVLQNGADPHWRPEPAPRDYPGLDLDPVVDRELTVFIRSHLIVHGDDAGWYVPVDFPDMLYDGGGGELPGGILGSGVRLLAELRSLAPWLGIRLDPAGDLDDPEAARLNGVTAEHPWYRESTAWLHLYEATRLSLALRTAVVFS